MNRRKWLFVGIAAAVLLAAYLVWRGPSFYRLYRDWPLIAACAHDHRDCP